MASEQNDDADVGHLGKMANLNPDDALENPRPPSKVTPPLQSHPPVPTNIRQQEFAESALPKAKFDGAKVSCPTCMARLSPLENSFKIGPQYPVQSGLNFGWNTANQANPAGVGPSGSGAREMEPDDDARNRNAQLPNSATDELLDFWNYQLTPDASFFQDKPRSEPMGSENDAQQHVAVSTYFDAWTPAAFEDATDVDDISIDLDEFRDYCDWVRGAVEGADSFRDAPFAVPQSGYDSSGSDGQHSNVSTGNQIVNEAGSVRPPLVGQSDERPDSNPGNTPTPAAEALNSVDRFGAGLSDANGSCDADPFEKGFSQEELTSYLQKIDLNENGATESCPRWDDQRADDAASTRDETKAEPRAVSPSVLSVSSAASSKRLEWDSGADIGYGGPRVMYGLSTLERMAIGSYCSAFERTEPEGKSAKGKTGAKAQAPSTDPANSERGGHDLQAGARIQTALSDQTHFWGDDDPAGEGTDDLMERYQRHLEKTEAAGAGLPPEGEACSGTDLNPKSGIAALRRAEMRSTSLTDLSSPRRRRTAGVSRLTGRGLPHSHSVSDILGDIRPCPAWNAISSSQSTKSSSSTNTVVGVALPQELAPTPGSNMADQSGVRTGSLGAESFGDAESREILNAKSDLRVIDGGTGRHLSGRKSNGKNCTWERRREIVTYAVLFVEKLCSEWEEERRRALLWKILEDFGIRADDGEGFLERHLHPNKKPGSSLETDSLKSQEMEPASVYALKPYSPPNTDAFFYSPVDTRRFDHGIPTEDSVIGLDVKRPQSAQHVLVRTEIIPELANIRSVITSPAVRPVNTQPAATPRRIAAKPSSNSWHPSRHFSAAPKPGSRLDSGNSSSEENTSQKCSTGVPSSEQSPDFFHSESSDREIDPDGTNSQLTIRPSKSRGEEGQRSRSNPKSPLSYASTSLPTTTGSISDSSRSTRPRPRRSLKQGRDETSGLSDYTGSPERQFVAKLKSGESSDAESRQMIREIVGKQRLRYVQKLKKDMRWLLRLVDALQDRDSQSNGSDVLREKKNGGPTRRKSAKDSAEIKSRKSRKSTRDFGQCYPTPDPVEAKLDEFGPVGGIRTPSERLQLKPANGRALSANRTVHSEPGLTRGNTTRYDPNSSALRSEKISRTLRPVSWFIPLGTNKATAESRHWRALTDNNTSQLTLQKAFQRCRPDVFRNLVRRQDDLRRSSKIRKAGTVPIGNYDITLISVQNALRNYTIPIRFSSLHHKPYCRNLSHQQMHEQNKKIYQELPEVTATKEVKRRENNYKTNRLMAQLFKNNLKQKVLKGHPSLPITQTCT